MTAVEYWIVEDLRAVGCWLRFADRRRGAEHRPKLVETPETRRFRQVVREGLARGVQVRLGSDAGLGGGVLTTGVCAAWVAEGAGDSWRQVERTAVFGACLGKAGSTLWGEALALEQALVGYYQEACGREDLPRVCV